MSFPGFPDFDCLGGGEEVANDGCSVTYTESGATGLSLNCFPLFGGTQCETVTQVNVPVSFLEQTGPS